jgi:hypothetical protein
MLIDRRTRDEVAARSRESDPLYRTLARWKRCGRHGTERWIEWTRRGLHLISPGDYLFLSDPLTLSHLPSRRLPLLPSPPRLPSRTLRPPSSRPVRPSSGSKRVEHRADELI